MLKNFLSTNLSSDHAILEDFKRLVVERFEGVSICRSEYKMNEKQFCLYFDKHASTDSGFFDKFIEKNFT